MLGDDIVIAVIDVKGSNVRLGIDAPREVAVYREELLEAMKAEKAGHAAADPPPKG